MLCITVKNARTDAPLSFPFLWRYCFLPSWSEYLNTLILFCSFKTQKNPELNSLQACPSSQDSVCGLCRLSWGPCRAQLCAGAVEGLQQPGPAGQEEQEPQQGARAAGHCSTRLAGYCSCHLAGCRRALSQSVCCHLGAFPGHPPALACFLKLSALPPALR